MSRAKKLKLEKMAADPVYYESVSQFNKNFEEKYQEDHEKMEVWGYDGWCKATY